MPVTHAFWDRIGESEDWWLIIATPLVDDIGSRVIYEKLQPLLAQLSRDSGSPIMLNDIAVLSPRDPRVTDAVPRLASGGVSHFVGTEGEPRYVGSWNGGRFVYRLNRPRSRDRCESSSDRLDRTRRSS